MEWSKVEERDEKNLKEKMLTMMRGLRETTITRKRKENKESIVPVFPRRLLRTFFTIFFPPFLSSSNSLFALVKAYVSEECRKRDPS